MFYQFEDLLTNKPAPKLGAMTWSCNCQNARANCNDPQYTKMHATKVDGEGKCVLCGHYGYRIEKHVLYAQRSVLHRVNK